MPGICTGVAVEICTKRGVAVDVGGNHWIVALGAMVAVDVSTTGAGVGSVCTVTQAAKAKEMIMVSIRLGARRYLDSIKGFYQIKEIPSIYKMLGILV